MENIGLLFEKNKNFLRSRVLSLKYVNDTSFKEQHILIPRSTLIDIHRQVLNLTDADTEFYNVFCTKGLANCNNRLAISSGKVLVSPHSCEVLSSAAIHFNLDFISMIPATFQKTRSNGPNNIYFIWSTVNPDWLSPNQEAWFRKLLLSDDRDVTLRANVVETYDKDIFLSRKYNSLWDSAESRCLDFTLSLQDLREILTPMVCHYSNEELTCFEHNPRDVKSGVLVLPENYLTIDRLDSDLGYTRDNCVVCSDFMNKLKDQMPEDEFLEALASPYPATNPNLTKHQLSVIERLHNR